MTEPDDTAGTLDKAQAMKAQFVRVLSQRIGEIATDPQQTRNLVYELAQLKLADELRSSPEQARQVQHTLQSAIREIEQSFIDAGGQDGDAQIRSNPDRPHGTRRTDDLQPRSLDGTKLGNGTFASILRLAALVGTIGLVCGAVIYWTRLRPQTAALFDRGEIPIAVNPAAHLESTSPETSSQATAEQPSKPSMPLPSTFGVYTLSEGELQKLKALPGKIPDRRVAISAAINTPSATNLASGQVKFIIFRPDSAVEASGTEVRVVAKVARAMGVDPAGKASMVNAGDSWVVRSTSFPYKVGPVEDQPRMLLLQPENDGFALSPGRYIVVVKGVGYDFTVAGDITDPNQCVERINATNGAFYSPCPPRR